MDVNVIVQYGTLAGVLYSLYQVVYKQARWRSKADLVIDSIDVMWKPQVNQRLDTVDGRLSAMEQGLITQNQEILKELRMMNAGITTMDKNLALEVQARKNVEVRVDRMERG